MTKPIYYAPEFAAKLTMPLAGLLLSAATVMGTGTTNVTVKSRLAPEVLIQTHTNKLADLMTNQFKVTLSQALTNSNALKLTVPQLAMAGGTNRIQWLAGTNKVADSNAFTRIVISKPVSSDETAQTDAGDFHDEIIQILSVPSSSPIKSIISK